MSANHQRFDLDGIAVEVTTATPELASAVGGLMLGYQGRSARSVPDQWGSVAADISITLSVADQMAAPDSPPRFAFPPLRAFAREHGYLLVDDVGSAEVEPLAGRISASVGVNADAGACWRFAGLTLAMALLECLRARGRYALHAAAAISPAGELLLLTGRRGSGKTTSALALLQAGWRALSDDTVYLEMDRTGAGRSGDSTSLLFLGHPRAFHLRPDLIDQRPHLHAHAFDPPTHEPQDKRWFDAAAAFPGRLLARWQGPARLYFPEIVDQPRSQNIPLSPREALTRLLRESAFVFAQPELTPGHLEVLRRLVDTAPAARLGCGRDVFHDPARLVSLLQEGTCRSVASG